MTSKVITNECGMSLVEIVIGMVVIGLMFVSFLSLFYQIPAAASRNLLETPAYGLAAERLEEILADKRSTARGFPYVIAANYPDELPVTGMTAYDRTTTITNVEPDLVTVDSIAPYPYKRIDVKVSNSVIGDITLSMVVSDYQ